MWVWYSTWLLLGYYFYYFLNRHSKQSFIHIFFRTISVPVFTLYAPGILWSRGFQGNLLSRPLCKSTYITGINLKYYQRGVHFYSFWGTPGCSSVYSEVHFTSPLPCEGALLPGLAWGKTVSKGTSFVGTPGCF